MKGYEVLGITSNKINKDKKIKYADLLKEKDIINFLSEINFSLFGEVIIIHSIGPFAFEIKGKPIQDKNKDGIDDKIYELNFLTFKNFVERVLQKIEGKNILLTIVAFGSISDRYNIPWWQSYSENRCAEITVCYCTIGSDT